MKICTRILLVACMAIVPRLFAQTVSVLGDAASLPAVASANYSSYVYTGSANASLTANFDLIIDSMSVSLVNVTQTSQAATTYGQTYGWNTWGLYAAFTGFSLIGPNGTTVTL